MKWLRSAAAVALAFGLAGPAASAQEMTPEGVWEATNGLSRYTVSYCGDGQSLCAYVSWIHPDVVGTRNRGRFLGRTVFDNLKQVGELRWQGTVTIEGYDVEGTVELVAADRLRVTGCLFFVICQTGDLPRVE